MMSSPELARALHGVKAICEPVVRDTSMIISGNPLRCPVCVVNDRAGGLIALFELLRVDERVLASLIDTCLAQGDLDGAAFDRFTREHPASIDALLRASPFLSSPVDIETGLRHLVAASAAMLLAGTRDEQASLSMGTVRDLHAHLTSVMVENLPVEMFLSRFDRDYTAFHVDARDVEEWLVPSFFETMKGRLVVSIDPGARDCFSLPSSLGVQQVVEAPAASGTRSRRFVIMARAP